MKNLIAEGWVARLVDSVRSHRSRRRVVRPSALDDLFPCGFAVDLGPRRSKRGLDKNVGRPARCDAVARV